MLLNELLPCVNPPMPPHCPAVQSQFLVLVPKLAVSSPTHSLSFTFSFTLLVVRMLLLTTRPDLNLSRYPGDSKAHWNLVSASLGLGSLTFLEIGIILTCLLKKQIPGWDVVQWHSVCLASMRP